MITWSKCTVNRIAVRGAPCLSFPFLCADGVTDVYRQPQLHPPLKDRPSSHRGGRSLPTPPTSPAPARMPSRSSRPGCQSAPHKQPLPRGPPVAALSPPPLLPQPPGSPPQYLPFCRTPQATAISNLAGAPPSSSRCQSIDTHCIGRRRLCLVMQKPRSHPQLRGMWTTHCSSLLWTGAA
jgi:hypothetical protein